MAQFTLQLDDIESVDSKIILALTYNGAKLRQTFANKQALIDWSTIGEKPGLDDMVRHAVRKALVTDPTLSNPAHFIGKTLTVTITTEVS